MSDETHENAVVVVNGRLGDEDTAKDIPVEVQDQSTPPIDAFFLRSISTFTLDADTEESGIDVVDLVFDFYAVGGHGIVAGNEILLLDVIGDRSFYAVVLTVTADDPTPGTDKITVDRTIDHVFPASTALCRIVSNDMAVDGSNTPVIFSLRAGTTPIDFTRFILKIFDDSSMDDGKFGGITALTKGVIMRLVDGFNKTIFNWKTNGDIKQFAYDGAYQAGTLGPSGQESFTSRITFNGQDKHGVVLRITTDEVIQIIIQDDLTELDSFVISAMGHKTSGETS